MLLFPKENGANIITYHNMKEATVIHEHITKKITSFSANYPDLSFEDVCYTYPNADGSETCNFWK